MINPTFELPTFEEQRPEPRRVLGWVLLLGLMVLMVSAALKSYFSKNPDDSLLRRIVFQREMFDEANIPGTGFDKDTLESTILRLTAEAKTDEKSAVYVLTFQYELGRKLDPQAVTLLRSSSDSAHNMVPKVFRATRLSKIEGRNAADLLREKDGFVYDLVALRALEKGGLREPAPAPNEGDREFSLLAMGLGMLAVLGMGVCLLIGYLIFRLNGQLKPKGSPVGNLNPADAERFALRSSHHLLAFSFGPLLLLPLLPYIDDTWVNAVVMSVLIASVALLTLVPVRGKTITFKRLGIGTENLAGNILWGIVGAFANFPILIAVAMVSLPMFRGLPPPEHPIQFELEGNPGFAAVLLLFIQAAVFAPFWEEVTFRGLILPALTGLLRGPVLGVFLSSLFFAAIHPQGIPAWPALATIAAMAAFLTFQTRSLVPSIVMHAVHNSLILLMTVATG